MFEIDIEKEFSAAHCLRGYDGNCAHLHGHNWAVRVHVRAAELDRVGIALDFKKLKAELLSLLDELDHKNLSDIPIFAAMNPTSENLSKYIFEAMSARINTETIKVHRVRVSESNGSGATYFHDQTW